MKAQLTITLDEKGNTGINGPLQDKILCYGLLEIGRELVQDWHAQKAAERDEKRVDLATPDQVREVTDPNSKLVTLS